MSQATPEETEYANSLATRWNDIIRSDVEMPDRPNLFSILAGVALAVATVIDNVAANLKDHGQDIRNDSSWRFVQQFDESARRLLRDLGYEDLEQKIIPPKSAN